MSKIIAPSIHMNGTSRDSLLAGYQTLYAALGTAERAMAETYPNGRDYYPQGPDAINVAMEQHRSRAKRLDDIKAEIAAILEAPGFERRGP